MALLDGTDPNAGFFDQLQTPGNYGLLAAGLGILANARGANSQNAIGAGALAGLQAAQGAQQTAYLNDYRKAQAAKLQQDSEKQRALLGLLGGITPDGQAGGAAQAMPVAASGTAPASPIAPPKGGLANMSIDQVALIKALGGGDLTDAWKLAHYGQDRNPGSFNVGADGQLTYTPSIDKGQTPVIKDGRVVGVQNLPGAVESAASMAGATAGATAGAQAGYDLVPVPDGKGGTQLMPRAQAVGALGGGVQASTGLGRTPSQADQTFNESVAKASADTYNNLQTSGMNADKQIANYQRVGQLLDGFEGGTLSNLGLQGAKLANSLDIKLDEKLPAKEAAVAIGNQLALQLRDPANGGGMPGAMSDADRNFLQASVPNLTQSNAGRKQLIDYQVKVLERNKDVASFARKWRQKYGRLDSMDPSGNDFQTALSNWSANNPLFPQGQ
ncbi:hypothetical protein CAL26_23680 [Bordetella genomosp. 9]|uniref:Uncharacterized protein n=1 Tax=Bordetella genomosp. 9 TaxID=1416803 RepID=A0A261R644_9BORD|nr:hypothetical protein [Bordetella genomosp. 9]OZI20498.1 hypothetical protein CAL26_23680 [Bordetella genomosp. 9]